MPPQLKRAYGVRITDTRTGKVLREEVVMLTLAELRELFEAGMTTKEPGLAMLAGVLPKPENVQ